MEKIISLIKEIREEAKTQNRLGTSCPLYVVQTLETTLATEHDYDDSNLCIGTDTYGGSDEEIFGELQNNGYLEDYTFEDVGTILDIKEWLDDDVDIPYYIHITYTKNYYKDVAYFLLKSEADKYMEYQSHNLSSPRINPKRCGYASTGKLAQLIELINEED